MSRNLNYKQQLFIDEYLIDLNGTQAAIRAGYSKKTAYSHGQRMLKNVEIEQKISDVQESLRQKAAKERQEIVELFNQLETKIIRTSLAAFEKIDLDADLGKAINQIYKQAQIYSTMKTIHNSEMYAIQASINKLQNLQ